MKSIAVITDSDSELAKAIRTNLETIFQKKVQIRNYYLAALLPGERIDEDVVLVMSKNRVSDLKNHIDNTKKIIIVKRTLSKTDICKLFSIPSGTEVMVVNSSIETTMETIAVLYQLGIDHLRLVPVQSCREGIQIAVTPGESHLTPHEIANVIDFGHRKIDVSTFVEIICRLQLDQKDIHRRLIQYGEHILSLDSGVMRACKELYMKNEDMDTLINLSEEGVLLTDIGGEVQLFNQAFAQMFGIQELRQHTMVNDLWDETTQKRLEDESISNRIIQIGDQSFNVSKRIIAHFGQRTGIYYKFHETTYIRKLEQNLSRQLKEQGQIARYHFEDLITSSSNMQRCITLAKKLAESDLTVMITGESGTGKELMAQSIHNASPRLSQPFVAVNCAAMPETLLESELFGYDPGSFTGAHKDGKCGLFEQAHNGTIFLDEIGDMPILLQTKLLRVLQEQQVMRIGSQRVRNVNVRVIAATHRNLGEEVAAGRFRQDLYYRLNVLPLHIPPLRERPSDIPALFELFLERPLEIESAVQTVLLSHDWPGNVRELGNVAAYVSLMSEMTVCLNGLPHYLKCKAEVNCEKTFRDIEVQLKSVLLVPVLDRLDQQSENQGVGRGVLVKCLQSQGISATEGEVRGLLNRMAQLKLIEAHAGRKGGTLTPVGKQFFQFILTKPLSEENMVQTA